MVLRVHLNMFPEFSHCDVCFLTLVPSTAQLHLEDSDLCPALFPFRVPSYYPHSEPSDGSMFHIIFSVFSDSWSHEKQCHLSKRSISLRLRLCLWIWNVTQTISLLIVAYYILDSSLQLFNICSLPFLRHHSLCCPSRF